MLITVIQATNEILLTIASAASTAAGNLEFYHSTAIAIIFAILGGSLEIT